jgi:hypothetical protein
MSINLNGRVVDNKPKFINEQGGTKLTYNFVTDPKLKRGHNFGIIYVTSSNYDETASKGQSQQRKKDSKNLKTNLKNKNYIGQIKEKEEQEKKRNEKEGECGICTQKVTTTVRPTPITFEEIVQTDPLPPPPQPLLIWPKKTGIDKECQIEDGDLFNFDEEVQPLVHIIVSKTLEESRREVLEEEELKHIKEQQTKYKKLNEANNNRVKAIEEKERKRFEEHNRKKELKQNRIKMTKIFQQKLQSRMKAKQYISKLKSDCYNSLGQRKTFKNKDDNYYFTDLLPELHGLVNEFTKNDYLIVNKMNNMFGKKKIDNERKKHEESVKCEKDRLANNERIRKINRDLEEKRKQEEKERRAKRRHDKILDGLRKSIQEELVSNSEWAEDSIENIFNINGYYQKTKNATLTGGPIGQMALILNYLDKESPEFLTDDKISKIIDVYLEKSHPFFFLWNKEDLDKYKELNEGIETIEDITKASDDEYKKIVDGFFKSGLDNDDMLQLFFDVCETMELNKVKDTYIKIFTNLLNKFKEGIDYGQTRFLEMNNEANEDIPLLCICLLNQEVIPLDNSPPDQSKNRGKKKFSFESYYYDKTLLMPTISDKLKIININKNFEKNYRNNLLECIDIMYGLEPDKLQCIEDLNNNYENFIKCLLLKLSEKYKKEIVDMAISFPKEGEEDEVVDTDPKQNKEDNE